MTQHPAHDRLVSYYRGARTVWALSPGVREAAVMLGMSERDYCDVYVRELPPILWTSSSSRITSFDCDQAFEDAAP